MASSRMLKDPDELRAVSINWRSSLSKGDAITDSVWEVVPSGALAIGSPVKNQLSTAAIASAGAADVTYAVTNRITTQYGLSLEKTISIRVQNRVG